MDHVAAARALEAAASPAPGFVQPNYQGRGIANLGPALLHAFGVEESRPGFDRAVLPPHLTAGVRTIVCIVVDALGYRQLLAEIARQPDLHFARLIADPAVSFAPLTSVFPSTTVNALTTMSTGVLPGEHGILGYTMHLRELGAVTEMIRFGPYAGPWSFADHVDPVAFLNAPTLFQRLRREAGVRSITVNFAGYRDSALTRMHSSGAEFVPYLTLSDMMVNIRELLEAPDDGPLLISAYYGALDGIAHVYGALTSRHAAEVASIDYQLRRELLDRARRPDTLLLLLADHGHVNRVPERTVDLTRDEELMDLLVVAPTGEARARYLHARDGQRAAIERHIAHRWPGIATLLDSDEAVERGLFGPEPLSRHARARIGDFVLLAHENWYFHHYLTEAQREPPIVGCHGGLTPEEMLVPLLAARLD